MKLAEKPNNAGSKQTQKLLSHISTYFLWFVDSQKSRSGGFVFGKPNKPVIRDCETSHYQAMKLCV